MKEGCYANIVASYFKQLEQQHAAKDYGTGTACPEFKAVTRGCNYENLEVSDISKFVWVTIVNIFVVIKIDY